MTDKERRVLFLLAEGKTVSEIAKEIGTTKQNVWQLAQSAVRTKKKYDKYYPAIGEYLSLNQLTLGQLAESAGVSRHTLSQMVIHGKDARWSTITKIANVTGISTDELLQRREINDDDAI